MGTWLWVYCFGFAARLLICHYVIGKPLPTGHLIMQGFLWPLWFVLLVRNIVRALWRVAR